MRGKIYDSAALRIENIELSNYALLLVVVLLLFLIALLLIGIPYAISTLRKGG